jgi:4-hydroxy-3-polyprenylbenzoate decarboxylase
MTTDERPLVLAITGASGAVYARRLLDVLVDIGHEVHLTISPAAKIVFAEELGVEIDLDNFDLAALLPRASSNGATDVHYHHYTDFMAPAASGSALTRGMVVCPCSGGTLSAIVHGTSGNLIHRAAEVHLKEKRRLVVVPRETPLSMVHLENMKRACVLGAVVLPASPGWYHGVEQINDLVDFIVARILDQFEIEHNLMRRWGDDSQRC